jgi:hypothetical protein
VIVRVVVGVEAIEYDRIYIGGEVISVGRVSITVDIQYVGKDVGEARDCFFNKNLNVDTGLLVCKIPYILIRIFADVPLMNYKYTLDCTSPSFISTKICVQTPPTKYYAYTNVS